jgi:hypothetical protein
MNLKDGAKIVLNRAEAMAEQNQSLGQTIDCDRIDDIDLGQWNKATRTFTELPMIGYLSPMRCERRPVVWCLATMPCR